MVQQRPPSPFDFDNASSSPTWLLQFENFSFATGLYVTPTDVQVHPMLHSMDPKARVVLSSTTPAEADLDIAAVKNALTDHFVHQQNDL